MARSLPPYSSLSDNTIFFLNSKLSSEQDLDVAPTLLSEIRTECDDLDQSLSDLNARIQSHLTRHASQSGRVGSLFSNIHAQLHGLQQSTSHSPSDGVSRRGMGEELQALAKEVARVKTVRKYAETALKLDTLVGDIEDVVSSTLRRHALKNNSEESKFRGCLGELSKWLFGPLLSNSGSHATHKQSTNNSPTFQILLPNVPNSTA